MSGTDPGITRSRRNLSYTMISHMTSAGDNHGAWAAAQINLCSTGCF